MKIAVISDTHIKENNIDLLKEFLNKISTYDMIIHAGDIITYEAYEILKSNNNLTSVHGNVDDDQCKMQLKEKEILNISTYKIGIFHGHGEKSNTLKRVKNTFTDDTVDIVIFGHSHKPCIFTEKNTIYLNPGSPFYKRKEPYYSFIILEIDTENITASIRFFKNI